MTAPAAGGDARELADRDVLLAVTGGIAAYKAAGLARALVRGGARVQVVLTAAAEHFVGAATFAGLTGRAAYSDVLSDPERILHVRLAREAEVAVVAPATANAIAKFAHGLADDLVSSTFTCLTCPVVVAPAMHTEMWEHEATRDNVALLRRRGVRIVGPGEGELAGGDVGPGRLADEGDILRAVAEALAPATATLAGRRLLVTAGGTREPIDPVRFVGNRSSGRMGYAVAAEAARRGGDVTLVSGPTALPEPAGVKLVRVETAAQMREAVLDAAATADAVVKAAAVADYRPAEYAEQKIKKHQGTLELRLAPNPDILAELGAARRGPRPVLVGFAAETADEEARGREKLERKRVDLVVVNRVDAADAGFDTETNRALLLGRDGFRREVPLTSKASLAAVILDEVEALLGGAGARSRP